MALSEDAIAQLNDGAVIATAALAALTRLVADLANAGTIDATTVTHVRHLLEAIEPHLRTSHAQSLLDQSTAMLR